MGTTVFRGIKATDKDSGLNQQLEYKIIPGPEHGIKDGFNFFSIALPHQGFVTVKKPLDFESTHQYLVNIEVMVS